MDRKVASFIALAREDLRAAKSHCSSFPRHAAFWIEQAAEKVIKAVLTQENIGFPVTHHQLGALATLLPSEHEWREDLRGFDRFSPSATVFRYPTGSGAMPKSPDPAALAKDIAELERLIPEIEDWCRERG